MNTIATELSPEQNLEDKHNFKRFFLIDRYGKQATRILLSVPNIELREEIICKHFLSRYVQFFMGQAVGVRIVSRDRPWDFELEFSNAEKLTVEITSIADKEDLFKKFKYEERIVECAQHEKIALHELVKLNYNFPDEAVEVQIGLYQSSKLGSNDLVPNPFYQKQFIFQSGMDDNIESFEKLLKDSIEKKVRKNHEHKNDVTLIIDNRTVSFSLDDILQHIGKMNAYFNQLPFKEVWVYTGYYSDNDGSNAEFSLAPIKITDEKFNKIISKLSK